jgi:hypothetical protein
MQLVTRVFKSDDFVFRVLCAVFGAHVMVVFGVETTFFEAILNPVYYKAMAGSLLIAFPVVEYTAFVSRRLDRKYDWVHKPLQRGLLQALFGVVITSVITFLLASLYFYARGINVFDTLYLRIDFPLVVCLLLVMNLLFVLQYLYRHIRHSAHRVDVNAGARPEIKNFDSLIVRTGNHTLSLPLAEAAYFYLLDDNRYVQTFQGRKLMVAENLEELEAKLDNLLFFRANRQVIISRGACTGYSTIEFGKLELICEPAFHTGIIVSQRKAREFRQWLGASYAGNTAPQPDGGHLVKTVQGPQQTARQR